MKSKRQMRKQHRRERGALRAALANRDMWKAMYFARLRELDRANASLAQLKKDYAVLSNQPHRDWVVLPSGFVVPVASLPNGKEQP